MFTLCDTSDNYILSKNISELRQRVAELKVENSKLNDDITGLQKAKEEKVIEVSSTYEQLLAKY